MPELPEVRTVAKVLKKNLLHQKVTNIKIIYPKIIEQTSLDLSNLIGHELKDITTREYILNAAISFIEKYDAKAVQEYRTTLEIKSMKINIM